LGKWPDDRHLLTKLLRTPHQRALEQGRDEDIKLEFKRRFAEAEIVLTDSEKEDIVHESQEILKFMIDMVSTLDEICGTTKDDLEIVRQQETRSLIRSRATTSGTRPHISRQGGLSDGATRLRQSISSDWDATCLMSLHIMTAVLGVVVSYLVWYCAR